MLKSHGQDYLVGNKLSSADVYLVKLLYHVEELDPSALANFPLLKVLYFKHSEEQRRPYLMGYSSLAELLVSSCLHSYLLLPIIPTK